MSVIDGFLLGEDSQQHHHLQQQQQQQRSILRSDVLSPRMSNLPDMYLANQSNRNASTSANTIAGFAVESEFAILSYKISLGFICACLCLLTISGNLLVLITFRRIRTVSISRRLSIRTQPSTDTVFSYRCI